MNEPRQAQFLKIGREGCYFFVLVHWGEEQTGKYIDAYQAYLTFVRSGLMTERCYLNAPDKILSGLTGQQWTCRKEPLEYTPTPGEYEATWYEKAGTSETLSHFVATDGAGMVTYDPMGGPLDAPWKPQSKRIFRRTA